MREAILCPQCGKTIPANAPPGLCPACKMQAELASDVAEQTTILPALARDPEEPIQARPVGSVERVVKWVKRRPMVAGLIVTVVLVAFVGLAAFGWAFRQTVHERDIAKKQLLRAESLLYISYFTEAHTHFLDHDLVKCRHTLDECRPDLRGLEYGYLVKKLENKARTLRGHTTPVSSLALSGDGKRLASGSADFDKRIGEIKVWDLEAGKETLTLRGHTAGVLSLALSGDGKRLVSGSDDNTIKMWDLEAGKETLTLREHTGCVTGLALSGDGKLFSGSYDKTIKVWDLGAGK